MVSSSISGSHHAFGDEKPDWRVIPKDTIRFFSDTMQISIGTTFKGREKEFRKAVTKILVTGKHSQALKELQAELGTLLQNSEMLRRMNWMLHDMTNRAQLQPGRAIQPDRDYRSRNRGAGRRLLCRDKKTGHFVGVSYDSMQIHTLHRNRNTARYLRIL
ncbi:MAG: hypothetical protein KDK39_14760 [Leptospiraceae bacterium]|nr:hypothetical protein [Leptospiraceae bacterium]